MNINRVNMRLVQVAVLCLLGVLASSALADHVGDTGSIAGVVEPPPATWLPKGWFLDIGPIGRDKDGGIVDASGGKDGGEISPGISSLDPRSGKFSITGVPPGRYDIMLVLGSHSQVDGTSYLLVPLRAEGRYLSPKTMADIGASFQGLSRPLSPSDSIERIKLRDLVSDGKFVKLGYKTKFTIFWATEREKRRWVIGNVGYWNGKRLAASNDFMVTYSEDNDSWLPTSVENISFIYNLYGGDKNSDPMGEDLPVYYIPAKSLVGLRIGQGYPSELKDVHVVLMPEDIRKVGVMREKANVVLREAVEFTLVSIRYALERYGRDVGALPTSAQGLTALTKPTGNPGWAGPYMKVVPTKDLSWDQPITYIAPRHGRVNGYLLSPGPDGKVESDLQKLKRKGDDLLMEVK